MNKLTLTFFLFIGCTAAAGAVSTITLPDNGVYYYWIRTVGGTIGRPPASVSGTGKINLPTNLSSGATLFVLDPHSGGIADIPLSGLASVTTISVDEFHVPASTVPAVVDTTASSTGGNTTASPAPTTPPGSEPSLFSRIVTGFISLAVLAAVVVFIRSLILTKGALLIETARKVGIEVPNPDDLPLSSIEKDGKYEPPVVVRVQSIPEEAIRPPRPASTAGYLITDEGTSYGIGSKVLSIGRDDANDIVLADTSVSRRHARVELLNGAAIIVDESSANGVFVNGERIAQQPLTPGDRVHVGRVPMRYER
jgi:hypothetical protein